MDNSLLNHGELVEEAMSAQKIADWSMVYPQSPATYKVLITPVIAKDMLMCNTSNRPLSEPKVARIVAKIKAGDWVLTHQGVAFSTEGKLLDGQHRLMAIAIADKPIEMFVTYGLAASAFDHIDTGGKRTAADLFAIRQPTIKYRTLMCGTANAMMRGISDSGFRPTASEVAEFCDWYKDMIYPVVEVFSSNNQVSFMKKSSIIAAFCNAARPREDKWPGGHGNRELSVILKAANRLIKQEWDVGKGDPLRSLYNKVVKSETSARTGGGLSRIELYACTVSALRAELRGHKSSMIFASDVEWGGAGDYGQKKR